MLRRFRGGSRYEAQVSRLDPVPEHAPGTFRTSAWSSTPVGRHVYEGGLPDNVGNLIAKGLRAASPEVDRIVHLDLGPSYPESSTVQSTGVDCRPGARTHRSTRHQRRGPRAWRAFESRTGDLAAWRGYPAIERYTEPHLAASGSIEYASVVGS